MTNLLIDSHCHLDLPAFDKDRQQVLLQAEKAGVIGLVIPGTTAGSWQNILDLASRSVNPLIYPALGLHPYFCTDNSPDQIAALRSLALQAQPIAIGEIGLDFQMKNIDQELQLQLFEYQLQIAVDLALPVILHTRKAHDQVLKLLKQYPVIGGISHAFNGSLQQAEKYMNMGFCLGFGGMLTYPRSSKLRKLASELPLETIVLETDAPDMPGQVHQYQRNSPAYLPEVLSALSEIRTETPGQIATVTTNNVRRVLSLSDRKQPTANLPDG
jgi:TatD DNase family protein